MADKFEDLRTFVTVAETGGISTAASVLGIVKSAVSRRLAELEERLGVTLIARTTRSFALTETGHLFLKRAKGLLAELDGLERIGMETDGTPLTVMIEAALADAVLPSVVALVTALPDLRVVLTTGGPADVTVALGQTATAPDPRSRVLATTPLVHCASPAYLERRGSPATAEDLSMHDLIAIAGGGASRRSAAAGGWLTVPDVATAVGAAVAGAGIATVPLVCILPAVAAGSLIMLSLKPQREPLHVVATIGAAAPAAAALLLDRIAADLRIAPA